MAESGTLAIERIRAALSGRRVGRRIVYCPTTTSTNDEAWRRIDDGSADGSVVLAEHQSAGRGRMGRSWNSPRGASALLSVALLDSAGGWTGGELGVLAALAACEGIFEASGVAAQIKWPNDLRVDRRKLGGVLVESRRGEGSSYAHVIGVGVNCLQQRGHLRGDLAETATSLEIESDRPIDRTGVAIALLQALDRWLGVNPDKRRSALREAWSMRCEPMGSRVRVRHRGAVHVGTLVDIDPHSALIVELESGGRRAFEAANSTILEHDGATST